MDGSSSSLFLVCGNNPDFTNRVGALLDECGLAWTRPQTMGYLERDRLPCAGVLVEGEDVELTNTVLDARSRNGWADIPIVILGGEFRNELPTGNGLTQIAMPLDSQPLEWVLRKVASPTIPVPAEPGSENRSSFRYRCDAECWISMDLKVTDVSEGGAQLQFAFPLPEGATIRLFLGELEPRSDLAVSFRILKTRGPTADGDYRIHGKFVELTGSQRRQLRKILVWQQVRLAQRVKQLSHI